MVFNMLTLTKIHVLNPLQASEHDNHVCELSFNLIGVTRQLASEMRRA